MEIFGLMPEANWDLAKMSRNIDSLFNHRGKRFKTFFKSVVALSILYKVQ